MVCVGVGNLETRVSKVFCCRNIFTVGDVRNIFTVGDAVGDAVGDGVGSRGGDGGRDCCDDILQLSSVVAWSMGTPSKPVIMSATGELVLPSLRATLKPLVTDGGTVLTSGFGDLFIMRRRFDATSVDVLSTSGLFPVKILCTHVSNLSYGCICISSCASRVASCNNCVSLGVHFGPLVLPRFFRDSLVTGLKLAPLPDCSVLMDCASSPPTLLVVQVSLLVSVRKIEVEVAVAVAGAMAVAVEVAMAVAVAGASAAIIRGSLVVASIALSVSTIFSKWSVAMSAYISWLTSPSSHFWMIALHIFLNSWWLIACFPGDLWHICCNMSYC